MSFIAQVKRRLRGRSFARDERGIAAVEFGLVSTALFTLMAGAIDVGNALIVQRDVNRAAVEIGQSLASCADQDCVVAMMRSLNERKANLLISFPDASLGMADVRRKDDKIEVQAGLMTYLPPDVDSMAMTTLANNDFGCAVLITYTHQPFIVGFAEKWGMKVVNMRGYTVTLRRKDVKSV